VIKALVSTETSATVPVNKAYKPRVLTCCVHTHTHGLPRPQQMRYYCHTRSTSCSGTIQAGLSPLALTFRHKSAFTTKLHSMRFIFHNHTRPINVQDSLMFHSTGRFIMFSLITNIYNKKTTCRVDACVART